MANNAFVERRSFLLAGKPTVPAPLKDLTKLINQKRKTKSELHDLYACAALIGMMTQGVTTHSMKAYAITAHQMARLMLKHRKDFVEESDEQS